MNDPALTYLLIAIVGLSLQLAVLVFLVVKTLKVLSTQAEQVSSAASSESITVSAWDAGAEKELKKIPFFVRGKARRNTERFAMERGITVITTETLYESKAYFSQS